MNAPFIAPRAPGFVRRLLACAVAGIATAILRADLVTMHVSYSGGSPSAHLHVSLGTESLRLDGSAAEGAFSVSLHPEEAMLVQIMGDGIGDYRVSFSPPPPFGMIIEGARRSAFASASASPRPVNHPLLVTMVRRTAYRPTTLALGQASSIAWHPPKILGAKGPYLDFNLGEALNGEALPPLRIPLLPRGSEDEPLPLDLPDASYIPSAGGFKLVAPQVVARLTLDAQNNGSFWVTFQTSDETAPFARYHFQFPLWPGHWSASRQARVLNDRSASGSDHNYETTLTGYFTWSGMVQTSPTNTWTLIDWRREGQASLRTVLGRRDATPPDPGKFGAWFISGTITDTTEVRSSAQDAALAETRRQSYRVYDRWLTEDPLEGVQMLVAPHETTEGLGNGNYVTRFLQDPSAPTIIGSETPRRHRSFTDASSAGKKVYETWLDSSPEFNPAAGWGSQLTPNGSAIATIAYDSSPGLAPFQLPTSIVQNVGTLTLARTDISYSLDDQIITAHRKDYASSSEHVSSVLKWYRPDASNAALRSRPRSLQHASGAKQSYAYNNSPTEFQVITLSGATGGGTPVDGLPGLGPVDPLHLLPYRSTKTVEIFQRGLLTRRETWVYVGGSGAAPVFNNGNAVAWETFEYTPDGRLKKRAASNNTGYEAEWVGSRKSWEKDETGLTTRVRYDDLDRVIALEREAVGGLPPQATSFAYDAANRIRFQRVGPVDANGLPAPAGEQIVTEFRYDQGGRLTHRIDPGGETGASYAPQGIATSYQYSNGDRDVAETRGDGHRSVTRYADARLRSVSGTSVVVPETYTYSIDATGRRTMTVLYSGQRPRTTIRDWLGRDAESQTNGPLQDGGISRPIVTTHRYDSRGLLAASNLAELNGATPLPLSAEHVFEYDEFGALRASGLNLDGTPGLQAASTDRLTASETRFHLDATGTWWLLTTTRLYHTDGSAAHHTSQRFTRLTGFAGGQTWQVDQLDFHNNRTSESAAVNSIQKTRMVTSLAANATRRVTTTAGGFTLSEQLVNDAGGAAQPTTYTYDAQGRLRQATSPRGIVTRHEYHIGTRQRRQTFEGKNELGQDLTTATFAYDASGRISGVTDALGRTTTTTYYPTGLVRDRGGDGAHPLRYEYNQHGQLKELWTYRSGPGATADKTAWEYDLHTGWLTRKTDAAGRNISYKHSHASPYRVVTRTSPRSGLTTTYRYRLDTGELATVDYADGTPDLAYTYTRTGQLDTVSDATGTRDYFYDREQLSAEHFGAWYGGLVLTTLPDNTTVQDPTTNRVPGRYAGFALGYVPAGGGTPQTQDLAREMKVALGYDDFGRPNSVAVSHGGQASATFAYDYTPDSSFWRSRSSGQFRQERTPEVARNVLKSTSASWGATLLTEHVSTTNNAGELSSTVQRGALFNDYGSDHGATSVVYGYNGTGELISAIGYVATVTAQPMPGRAFSYGYDTAGNRRSVGVGPNQATYFSAPGIPGANALNQVRERDTLPGRISGTAHPDAGVGVAGASVSRTSGTRYWDAVIAGWGKFSELSVTSNRNGQSQSAAVWRLIRPERERLEYDEEGNLIADSQWRYQYDAENRLIRMTTRSESELPALGWQTSPPRRELHFKYDHLGRRVEKTVLRNGSVTFNRRFVYAGWNLIAEFELVNGVPNVRRSYAWGLDAASSLDATGGIGALVLQTIHQGATRTHYHVATDGHGSVTALLDQNGSAAAVYEYDPFGQLLRAEGATAAETLTSVDQPGDNPFRYSTKYWDRETGLYDYGLRFYDPSLGRFINRDPIAEAGGTNLYAFVGNSPVNRFDYLGLNDRARPFGPADYVWGPTPESSGEDGSYRSRNGVDIRDNAEFPQDWGTDESTGEVVIGLVATGALPRIGVAAAEGTAVRGLGGLLGRLNPLGIVAALLSPTTANAPGANLVPHANVREGFVIPENADPDLIEDFFSTRHTDPERARRLLREIWSSADIRTVFPSAVAFPNGFKDQSQFDQAATELLAALRNSGINDGSVGVRGSSITGVSSNPNSPSFGRPFGPKSDIDFFVQSAQITERFQGKKFIHPDELIDAFPALEAWSKKWTQELGRKITPAAWKPGSLPNTPSIIRE